MKKTLINYLSLVFLTFFLLISLILLSKMHVSATQSKSQNFNSTSLTGDPATDMVRIAVAQADRNYTSLGYTEPWCADFVSDCAKIIGQSEAIPFNGGAGDLYRAVINAGGKQVNSPQCGDLIFYYCTVEKQYAHVGIMKNATLSISGNTVGKVWDDFNPRNYLDKNDHKIGNGITAIYVRPNYKQGSDYVKPSIWNLSIIEQNDEYFKYTYSWQDNIGVVKDRNIFYSPNGGVTEQYFYDHAINSNSYITKRDFYIS